MSKKKVSRNVSVIYDKEHYPKQKTAYTRLRDNVLFYALDGNKKVFEVASSVSFEAKTTVSINLAVTLSESGKKVCIVDLDLKKPKVHRTFGIQNEAGLIDYMLGKISYEQMFKPTNIENLSFINRGQAIPDSQVLFQSEKFNNLFERLKEEFDYIIVDTSPILLTSDYIHLSKLADGIVFAIAYAKTKKLQVNEALNLLKGINAPICGAVYTFYDPKIGEEYNDYYGYYSYHSYE